MYCKLYYAFSKNEMKKCKGNFSEELHGIQNKVSSHEIFT